MTKEINYTSEDDSVCPRDYKDRISPHQEPVDTQHDVECKGCGGVSCKNKVLKGGTVCPSCFDKMTTQEPIEWAKEFTKQFGINQYGGVQAHRQDLEIPFIANLIKQAEERHNQDCTREEWARVSEREVIKRKLSVIKRWVMTIRDNEKGYAEDECVIRESELLSIITNQ
jgi:hypothetical protein